MFLYWKIFFSHLQVPEHTWKQLEAPFRKIWGQNISPRIRIRIRKIVLWIRIRKKWVRIHNTDSSNGNYFQELKEWYSITVPFNGENYQIATGIGIFGNFCEG
jgi:hypothetical protein